MQSDLIIYTRKIMSISKTLLTLVVSATISSASFAANGPGSFPGANGKPFQALQEQINIINMTIAEQKRIYDAKFAQLAAKDGEHDALIGAITVALNLVTTRVGQNEDDIEALELADSLHDQLLAQLSQRLTRLEASTSADFANLYEQDRLINLTIGALEARLNILQNAYNATATLVNSLRVEIISYRNRLTYLNTLLGSYCSAGEVLTGVYANGQPRCADINQLGNVYTQSSPLALVEYCDSDIAGFCVDEDYYEYGYAVCASGYVATGGGFSLDGTYDSGGSGRNMQSRPSGDSSWYVQSNDHGNNNYSGTVYVRCLQNQ
jgi:hypothetical protein